MMRILILTKYFPPEIGAASHLFYELAESLVGKGHKVTVVTSFPTYNVNRSELNNKYRRGIFLTEDMNGVRVKRLRGIPFPIEVPVLRGLDHLLVASAAFLRGLFTGKQDIILIYSPPLTLGLSALALSKLRKIPFAVNVQDLFPQNAIDLGLLKNRPLIKLFGRMEKFVYRKAASIVVHSEGNRKHVVAKGATPSKVIVISNWVDTELIKPEDRLNGFREENSLGEKFVVSFAGTMGYSQDLDSVLESAALLKSYKDILFILVGDGVEKECLENKARELNLKDINVRFFPMQPREKYPEVLNASDVSLVTLKKTVKTPVVPSKLLSIMASGRPVLAAMNFNGDAPKLIEEAECGYCVKAGSSEELAEAILKLYKNPSLRECMGSNGRHYVEKHLSRVACIRKYEQLFLEACNLKDIEGGNVSEQR